MADSAKLSAKPLNSQQNSSSRRTSSTLSISSDDELHRQRPTGRDTWLDSSQATCQYTSDHELPTSSGTSLPAPSHENSHDGDAQNSTEASNIAAREDLTDTISGSSQATSTRGYRITEQASQPRNSHSGELLEAFRDRPNCLCEVGVKPPRSPNILKLWKWEVINCFLAVGLTGTMYTILRRYDRKPIPDWGTAINLSTLIALMATALRTMLVFVASEIIGQAKWNYLASGGRPEQTAPVRRLIETSRFNDASQGLLGAIKLLPTTIQDPVTLTAILVMIISLGTGSFAQQAIQTQACQFPVDGDKAVLPIARNLSSYPAYGSSLFGPSTVSRLRAALPSALAPDSEELDPPIAFVCSTGNCTFENPIELAHSTLGICSSCADTSSLVTSTKWVWREMESYTNEDGETTYFESGGYFLGNYSLPNGMSIEARYTKNGTCGLGSYLSVSAEQALGLNWAGDMVSSKMKALSQWALANITILTVDWRTTNSACIDPVAATCTLYPCLRSYEASVRSAKLEEVLLDTIPALPDAAPEFPPEMGSEDIRQAVQESPYHTYVRSQFPPGQSTVLQAIQSPCLVNGTIWTKENHSSSLETQRVVLLHADPDPSGGGRAIAEITTAPTQCMYGIDNLLMEWDFASIMETLFNGSCYARLSGAGHSVRVDCDEAYWLRGLYSDQGTTADSIIKQIKAFTDRVSNKMRMGLLNNPESVYGQVLQMTVCSKIQYSWLVFPTVLVAVTAGLLAWTIFQSSRRHGRVKVWKTSILPFLFYSDQFVVQNAEDMSADSNESSQREEGLREPLLNLDQMEAEARQRKVRFEAFD